ncbi:MAG TPA: SDR family oxidoreductase [Aquabacterium sp.]|nr:SDR family oxidoreductase [Aquabacterium sp.]
MTHIVIAGASGAIGTALVTKYLDDGHVVTAVVHRSKPAIEHDRFGCVTDFGSIGKLDSLVTLTGHADNAKLGRVEMRQWEQVIDSTLTSVFKAINETCGRIKEGGSIVVVGSIVGSLGGYGCANYAAAKAGLVGLVRAAANELASRKVRVNLLELGYVNAGMGERLPDEVRAKVVETIPLKRFAEVDEVLHAIEFLRTATYATGTVLSYAGGLR